MDVRAHPSALYFPYVTVSYIRYLCVNSHGFYIFACRSKVSVKRVFPKRICGKLALQVDDHTVFNNIYLKTARGNVVLNLSIRFVSTPYHEKILTYIRVHR
ncbi:hypothetical protein BDF21DRAFT_399833 [Thamnidium elegans]|nr:hypothetical protein BDF21DRAFT_399833 [Thamnidium elegans]